MISIKPKDGLFITVEGTDGSGKSTQIKLMEAYLKEKGFEVILTREPGGSDISEKIRSIILDPENTAMARMSEFLLYEAARAQLVCEVIKPALKEGRIVICDRFIDSTYVYQGFGRGIDFKLIEKVNEIAMDGICPHLTIFFDLSPEIALGRRAASTGTDRIENERMEFHMRVYEGYKKLVSIFPERIKAVDSRGSIDEIASSVRAILDKVIQNN